MNNVAYLWCMVLGFSCTIVAIVVGKITVYRINNVLNAKRASNERKPGWAEVIDKNNGGVIAEYRRKYPRGPLNRGLILTWILMGFGLLVVIASSVADHLTR